MGKVLLLPFVVYFLVFQSPYTHTLIFTSPWSSFEVEWLSRAMVLGYQFTYIFLHIYYMYFCLVVSRAFTSTDHIKRVPNDDKLTLAINKKSRIFNFYSGTLFLKFSLIHLLSPSYVCIFSNILPESSLLCDCISLLSETRFCSIAQTDLKIMSIQNIGVRATCNYTRFLSISYWYWYNIFFGLVK